MLPTDFNKRFTFQLLVKVKKLSTKERAYVIIICPLQSIIRAQLVEANLLIHHNQTDTTSEMRVGFFDAVTSHPNKYINYQCCYNIS